MPPGRGAAAQADLIREWQARDSERQEMMVQRVDELHRKRMAEQEEMLIRRQRELDEVQHRRLSDALAPLVQLGARLERLEESVASATQSAPAGESAGATRVISGGAAT